MRGLAIARAGLATEQMRSEVASHNLSNIATPDYQRRVMVGGSFTELLVSRLDGEGRPPAALGALGAGPAVAAEGRDEGSAPTPGGSNVDPAREMVDLMTAVRSFEAIQRAVQAQDDVTRKAATELGRV